MHAILLLKMEGLIRNVWFRIRESSRCQSCCECRKAVREAIFSAVHLKASCHWATVMSLTTVKNAPWADELGSLLYTHFQCQNVTLVKTDTDISRNFCRESSVVISVKRDKRLPAPPIYRQRRQVTWPSPPLRNDSIWGNFFHACFFPINNLDPSDSDSLTL